MIERPRKIKLKKCAEEYDGGTLKRLFSALSIVALLSVSGCSQAPLAAISEKVALPVEIVGQSLVFSDSGPSTSFSALVRNPNADLGIEINEISVTALDEFGAVVGQADLNVFFLSPGAEGIVETRFDFDVREVEVTVDQNPAVMTGPNTAVIAEDAISDLRIDYSPGFYNYAYVRSSVQIPDDVEYPEIQACAAVFSSNGEFLAGRCDLHEVLPGRKNGIETAVKLPPGTTPTTAKRFFSY